MELPLWYKIITYQKRKRMISYGLTIPYLIGAYKLFQMQLQPINHSINLLLEEIINSNIEHCATLQKCPDIRHYVIGIESKKFCMSFFEKELNFTNVHKETTLIVTQNASTLGKTIEEIEKSLKNEYNNCIKNGNFSWDNNSKTWKPFNDKEIELILNTK